MRAATQTSLCQVVSPGGFSHRLPASTFRERSRPQRHNLSFALPDRTKFSNGQTEPNMRLRLSLHRYAEKEGKGWVSSRPAIRHRRMGNAGLQAFIGVAQAPRNSWITTCCEMVVSLEGSITSNAGLFRPSSSALVFPPSHANRKIGLLRTSPRDNRLPRR